MVSRNFPSHSLTNKACIDTVGCRSSMFRVAQMNWAMNCLKLSFSPCTTLCKDAKVATTGLQSANWARNRPHRVLKKSTKFAAKSSTTLGLPPVGVVGNRL